MMRGIRLVGMIVLFVVAASGCGSATGSATATTSVRPSSMAASATIETTASPSSTSSLPLPCDAATLEVRGGRMGGGTGTAHADLYFTDVGPKACSLAGKPKSVEFLRADGRPLAITSQGPEPDPVPPATLAPGVRDAASVAYNWSNWCGNAPGPLRVRVELPNGEFVTGAFDGPPAYDFVPRCDQPSYPSILVLLWGFANPTP
jgi:Protein of unknown function (DUF4232)